MNRENIRKQLSAILMDTNEEHPLDCNIMIGEDEAMGLSTLQIPEIYQLFQQPTEGIIWTVINGYQQPVEFDNLTDFDIQQIAKYFEFK